MGTRVIQALGRTSLIGVVLVTLAACQAVGPRLAPTPAPEVTLTVPVLIKDKAVISAAADVLSARLKRLGIGNFSVAIGDSMVFTLPAVPLPDQAKIRAAFGAHGSVVFLPLTSAASAPPEGAPAPAGIAPLFDALGQVASAEVVQSNGHRPWRSLSARLGRRRWRRIRSPTSATISWSSSMGPSCSRPSPTTP